MLWQLNLRHLRSLTAISRLGSISAAAQAVSISQPAVTQGIARLEAQLGIALFERRPDGMTPAKAATVFAPRADAALRHIGSTRVTMAQMRALLALASAGSYPAASAASGLAQPTLHRAIADLSLALRRTLVERRGKGIAFTESGQRTIRAFRLARAELEAGLSEIERLKGRETGRIAIGAMPLARARVLPAAVAAFHAAHPDVKIAIAEGSFAELIEPLRDGELDFTVGALRDPAPGPDVEQAALFVDKPVIVARKDHPLVAQSAGTADLARYPWIVPPPGTPLHSQWVHMFDSASVGRPNLPIECGSVITIRQILIETDFLTLLSPDQVAVELEAGWLEIVSDTPPGLSRMIGITTRAGWRPTALQSAFIEMLRACAGR